MKKFQFYIISALMLGLMLPGLSIADDPGFKLGRFVTCDKVTKLEPSAVRDTFTKDTRKVYAFIEATDIKADTLIRIQWLFEGKETALIELTLPKGSRWRTYSSKRIGMRYGSWEVRMLDAQNNLIKSLTFKVS